MCASTRAAAATVVPRPRWARLYGLVVLGLAILALADVTAPPAARPAIDGLVAAAVVVAIALWIRSNAAALDQQPWCACAARTVTVRVIPSRRPRTSVADRRGRGPRRAWARAPD